MDDEIERNIPFDPAPHDVVCTKLRTWNLTHPGNLAYQELILNYALQLAPLDGNNSERNRQIAIFAEAVVDAIEHDLKAHFLKIVDGPDRPTECIIMDRKAAKDKARIGLKNKFEALKKRNQLQTRGMTMAVRREGGSSKGHKRKRKQKVVQSNSNSNNIKKKIRSPPQPLPLTLEPLPPWQRRNKMGRLSNQDILDRQAYELAREQRASDIQQQKQQLALYDKGQVGRHCEEEKETILRPLPPIPKRKKMGRPSKKEMLERQNHERDRQQRELEIKQQRKRLELFGSDQEEEESDNEIMAKTQVRYQAKTLKGNTIHAYALELISHVCNHPSAGAHVLNEPGPKYIHNKAKKEPQQERLIRLQLRHRFFAAQANHMPVVEFAKRILKLWGGTLEVLSEDHDVESLNDSDSETRSKNATATPHGSIPHVGTEKPIGTKKRLPIAAESEDDDDEDDSDEDENSNLDISRDHPCKGLRPGPTPPLASALRRNVTDDLDKEDYVDESNASSELENPSSDDDVHADSGATGADELNAEGMQDREETEEDQHGDEETESEDEASNGDEDDDDDYKDGD